MCLGIPLTAPPPTHPALAAPACFLDFSSRRPSSAAPLTYCLLQLPAKLGRHQTPEKHGPLTTEGEAVSGEHIPELRYPHLLNKSPLWFQVTPLPSQDLQCSRGLERTRKRVSVYRRQSKDPKSRSSPMKEPGLETIPPPSSHPTSKGCRILLCCVRHLPASLSMVDTTEITRQLGYPEAWADP